jgi:hypothetical protein
MTLKKRVQQRLRKLLKASGGRVEASVRHQLEALPNGWGKPVTAMFTRVAQVLTDDEMRTFRWTQIRQRNGRLAASWSGAGESDDLIDQIVEEAATDASAACVECGRPAFISPGDASGPHCLRHAGPAALAKGKAAVADMGRTVRDFVAKLSSSMPTPKAAAAALPALLADAQAYFRNPDGDAVSLVEQIREALDRFDQEVSRTVGISVVAGTPQRAPARVSAGARRPPTRNDRD